MPDRVNAAVDDMQPAGLNAIVDRSAAQSERVELPPRDQPVLTPGKDRDRPVDRTTLSLTMPINVKDKLAAHTATFAGKT